MKQICFLYILNLISCKATMKPTPTNDNLEFWKNIQSDFSDLPAQCSEALDLEALEQTKPWVLQIERD